MPNTLELDYYDMELIIALKGFIVQVPSACAIKLLFFVIDPWENSLVRFPCACIFNLILNQQKITI